MKWLCDNCNNGHLYWQVALEALAFQKDDYRIVGNTFITVVPFPGHIFIDEWMGECTLAYQLYPWYYTNSLCQPPPNIVNPICLPLVSVRCLVAGAVNLTQWSHTPGLAEIVHSLCHLTRLLKFVCGWREGVSAYFYFSIWCIKHLVFF